MPDGLTSGDIERQLKSFAYQEQVFLKAETDWITASRNTKIEDRLPGANWFSQVLPLKFNVAMVMTGRGVGKTRMAASWSRRQSYLYPGSIGHIVAPTFGDLRYVILEGESGLLNSIPKELVEDYNRSDYTVTLKNGTFIRGFSAEKPDRLRGPQCHWLWGDEVAAWQRLDEVMYNITFSTRLVYLNKDAQGAVIERIQPQRVYTTTPRPLDIIRELSENTSYIQYRGKLYENAANLAETFIEDVAKHEGTRLGDQEIHGILLSFDETAVIKRRWLRMWPKGRTLPQFEKVIVSFDTALTEDTYDEKTNQADYTACTVWGIFMFEKRMNIMLLSSWRDHLGMPELIEAAKKEMRLEYGHVEPPEFKTYVSSSAPSLMRKVIKPTLMIIEDKGSGTSLRQMLAKEAKDITMFPYNPGKADKLARLNAVAYVVKGGSTDGRGRVWIPESNDSTPEKPKFAGWSDQYLGEVCIYNGPGSTKNDDYVDTSSQAWRWFADNYLVGSVNDKLKARAPRPEARPNPYGG